MIVNTVTALGDRLILGIPNNNVRKQYYEYLMELFEEKASVDTDQLGDIPLPVNLI